ncbi:MAG: phage recombination protein Bet [Colwellia sp.]|nr:phage recombination protein Bet [Colwellia sp.]
MVPALTNSQLEVVKRTVAKDCNNQEFDLFIEVAKQTGLDPFRKQILPIIFSKNNLSKRSMTIIYSRDGLRCIASRCKNYRPKSKPAEFVYDESLRSEINPSGIVSVVVTLHMQDEQHEWHPVIGEAYWDEFAPIEEEWHWGDKKGEKVFTGKKTISDMWKKMPRNMIEKCAESQALRAGWPEQFAGIFGEEEMAKAIVEDLSASDLAEQGRVERMEKSLQFKGSIPVNFGDGIQFIKAGEYYDSWMKKIEEHKDNPQIILTLRDQNKQALIQYWQVEKDAALSLKEEFLKIEDQQNNEPNILLGG